MIKIGITGHRVLDKRFLKKYKKQVFKKLNELKQKYHEVILLSALADGADRLIVYEAIKLNIKFIAVLPMQKELYQEDFDSTSKLEFDTLLKNAKSILTISHAKPFIRDRQYELVGQYISENSDILIALWDGKYNNLQGGTSEIIKYHLKNQKELWYLKVDRNGI